MKTAEEIIVKQGDITDWESIVKIVNEARKEVIEECASFCNTERTEPEKELILKLINELK